jgi:hypothetical protein
MRKIQNWLLFWIIFLAVCAVRPPEARAQFIGFTSPQTVQQTLAAAGTACAGTPQTFATINLGQTQHTAIIIFSGSVANAIMQIMATDTATHTFAISSTVQAGAQFNGISAVATASGYYPIVSVTVSCAVGSTFTLTYIGESSTPPIAGGTSFLSLVDQQIFTGISGSSNQNGVVFQTPFANSSGMLRFSYASSAVAGSSLTVLCNSNSLGGLRQFAYTIANATGVQTFPVPPSTCPFAQVLYTSGGASGLITVEYMFDNQGMIPNQTLGTYTHITGTTATAAKATSGIFLGINLNTSGAGTISVFDLATAACTGTPSTNVVAVLTIAATENARSIPFNVAMLNGVCVKASAAMDFTVSSQ